MKLSRPTAVLALSMTLVGPTAAVAQESRTETAAPSVVVTAPSGVTASAPALAAEVSWTAAEEREGLIGYRVDIAGAESGTRSATLEVGPDAVSATVPGVPRWFEQIARVTAIYVDDVEASSAWSEEFQVLSSVTMVDPRPVTRTGDGKCCETYQLFRGFRLDASMPVDVWLRPTVVEFDGSGAHGGFEQTDERWPAAVNDWSIRVPAGETSGRYEINWWGDDWKRFEYAHWVFGFENWQHPAVGGGQVHVDRARQDFTIYEDDQYFWPDVIVAPTTTVDAGETARVKVRLDVPVARKTVLSYRVKDGTARAGRDYQRTNGLVTARPGQQVVWVRVPTTTRRAGRAQSTFSVRITGVRHDLARLTKRTTSQVRIVR